MSDYEFPQFVKIETADNPDIEIEYGGISDKIMNYIEKKIYCGFADKEQWFYNEVGIFWIHDNKINFIECNDNTVDDAAQYLPGMCLSILLWYHRMIMIHGACLRFKGKTIIIAGNSGAGKSTITTELIKKGAKLMADDVTGISNENGIYISQPAFPAQKLCEDQVDNNEFDKSSLRQIRYDLNKYEIPRFEEFYDKPSKVDMFFRIEKCDVEELEIEEVLGSEKLKITVNSIFINWLFNDAFRVEPEDMFRCIGIANQIKLYRIRRNREKNTLDKILRYIEETAEKEVV